MAAEFDPYHRWLGIPPKHQPADHYRLLGIETFEGDEDVILDAAERQIGHVRRYALGQRAADCQRILNELAAAKACLLDPAKKVEYDTLLRQRRANTASAGETPQSEPRASDSSELAPDWDEFVDEQVTALLATRPDTPPQPAEPEPRAPEQKVPAPTVPAAPATLSLPQLGMAAAAGILAGILLLAWSASSGGDSPDDPRIPTSSIDQAEKVSALVIGGPTDLPLGEPEATAQANSQTKGRMGVGTTENEVPESSTSSDREEPATAATASSLGDDPGLSRMNMKLLSAGSEEPGGGPVSGVDMTAKVGAAATASDGRNAIVRSSHEEPAIASASSAYDEAPSSVETLEEDGPAEDQNGLSDSRTALEQWETERAEFLLMERLIAGWDFRGAQSILERVEFTDLAFAAIAAAWRRPIRRLATAKSELIQHINNSQLDKAALMLPGMNGPVVGADEAGITATLLRGEMGIHRWEALSETSRDRLLRIALEKQSSENALAAGGLALAQRDLRLAERSFERARSFGEDIQPYLHAIATAEALGPGAASGHQQAWARHLGRPVELTNSIGMKFVLIPPGELLMDSADSERGSRDESQHRVRVTQPFYLATFEVTQSEYHTVMGRNPSWFRFGAGGSMSVLDRDASRFPVDSVSWEDAVEFCRTLSANSAEYPEGRMYRLPTEAEWEYACRAGTSTPFHFGAQLNGREANCDGRWPYGTRDKGPYLERTTTVGSYVANAFGLYDMHGNVSEWCVEREGVSVVPAVDERVGQRKSSLCVPRGGCWNNGASSCHSARRGMGAMGYHPYCFGFRPAFSAVDASR